VSVSIAPATAPPVWLFADAPVLTWTSAGAATVEVRGPGVAAAGPSGSVAVCPQRNPADCLAPLGTHTYTATARDAQGVVVANATATLTVG
jgi:hypothetical protein